MTDQTVSDETTSEISDSDQKKKDSVAYETYRRTLSEAKTFKEKYRELEAVLKQQEEEKLKANNEWKALAESREKTLLEAQNRLNEYEKTITDSIKLNAFNRILGGKIKSQEYYSFVDTDKIAYNPETKQVDEDSVKLVVGDFLKKHSALVEFKGARLPNEAASNTKISSGKKLEELSIDELKKLGESLAKQGLIK